MEELNIKEVMSPDINFKNIPYCHSQANDGYDGRGRAGLIRCSKENCDIRTQCGFTKSHMKK